VNVRFDWGMSDAHENTTRLARFAEMTVIPRIGDVVETMPNFQGEVWQVVMLPWDEECAAIVSVGSWHRATDEHRELARQSGWVEDW
jgi:hypothetical protein